MKDRRTVRVRTQMDMAASQPQPDAKLGREIQVKIGQQLRAMYDDVVNQGVPDRFVDLLGRIDRPADPPLNDGTPGDGKDSQ